MFICARFYNILTYPRVKQYYKLRAALPRSFTVKSMEEVYQDLSMVKHAANLAKQEILECVADQALGWLWMAFKKIHSDDMSKEACKCLNQPVLILQLSIMFSN